LEKRDGYENQSTADHSARHFDDAGGDSLIRLLTANPRAMDQQQPEYQQH
jgi:hypothetical protein